MNLRGKPEENVWVLTHESLKIWTLEVGKTSRANTNELVHCPMQDREGERKSKLYKNVDIWDIEINIVYNGRHIQNAWINP